MRHRLSFATPFYGPFRGFEPIYAAIHDAAKYHPFPQLRQLAGIMLDIIELTPDRKGRLRQFAQECICAIYSILSVKAAGFAPVEYHNASEELLWILDEIRTFVRKYARRPWYYIVSVKTKRNLGIMDFQDRFRNIIRRFRLDNNMPFHRLAQRCYEDLTLSPNFHHPLGSAKEARAPRLEESKDIPTKDDDRPYARTTSGFEMPQGRFSGDVTCTNVQGNNTTHFHNVIVNIFPQNLGVDTASANGEGMKMGHSEPLLLRRRRSCPAV